MGELRNLVVLLLQAGSVGFLIGSFLDPKVLSPVICYLHRQLDYEPWTLVKDLVYDDYREWLQITCPARERGRARAGAAKGARRERAAEPSRAAAATWQPVISKLLDSSRVSAIKRGRTPTSGVR